MTRSLLFAICALSLALGAGASEGQDPASSGTAQPTVPTLAEIREHDFAVTLLDGTSVVLSSLLGSGKPIVVEFWATWCPPCRKTLPTLLALKQEHDDGVVIVGLTVEDPIADMAKVQDHVKREAIDFTVAFAPRELFQFMNSRPDIAVPKLFVFDSAGGLVSYIPRYSPLTARKLESAVRKALSQR